MKVAFICGALEPGRDGVGDYTMRLADGVTILGNEVAIVAANDGHVKDVITESLTASIHILRVPAAYENTQRFEMINAFIKKFDPEWISLQYVAFSFHPKGLPMVFHRYLAQLLAGYKVHIMFHELWVGMDKEATLKLRLWGAVQRQLIANLIKKLRPEKIHTHTNLYQAQLRVLNVKAELLPLYGNIPVTAEKQPEYNDHLINFVIFGGIHYGAPIEDMAQEAVNYSKKYNKSLVLNFVGRCGKEQEKWMMAWKASGLEVKDWGAQDEHQVSEILASSTIGITTTPFFLVQKSGSVAAMKEHGLPVICVSRKWIPRVTKKIVPPSGIMAYEKGNLEQILQNSVHADDVSLDSVVQKFLAALA